MESLPIRFSDRLRRILVLHYGVPQLFQGLFQSIPGFASRNQTFDMFGLGPWALLIIYAALSPLLLILGLFIGSGILHLCLMMVGGANRSFETTFRVLCFASGFRCPDGIYRGA